MRHSNRAMFNRQEMFATLCINSSEAVKQHRIHSLSAFCTNFCWHITTE